MSVLGKGAVVGFAAVLALVGCSSSNSDDDATETSATPTPALPVQDRGALNAIAPASDYSAQLVGASSAAWRVTYRTTNGLDGQPTTSTGVVFVPRGDAPEGGFPVVSVAHGTTGIGPTCGPSASPNLRGEDDEVAELLARGYIVTATDYTGLGSGGAHVYLEPYTAGYNVIDAVRAARNATPLASTRWTTLGQSQGGQASWSAAELAPSYGDDLDFLGAAALSPAVSFTGILDTYRADDADAGAGTPAADTIRTTVQQKAVLPYFVNGLKQIHPDLDTSSIVRGALANVSPDVLASCGSDRFLEKAAIATQIKPGDIGPRSADEANALRQVLESEALPKREAGAPLYVVSGERDQLILTDWVADAVCRGCELGDVIDFRREPQQAHAAAEAVAPAIDWLDARFRGEPAPDTCGH